MSHLNCTRVEGVEGKDTHVETEMHREAEDKKSEGPITRETITTKIAVATV